MEPPKRSETRLLDDVLRLGAVLRKAQRHAVEGVQMG